MNAMNGKQYHVLDWRVMKHVYVLKSSHFFVHTRISFRSVYAPPHPQYHLSHLCMLIMIRATGHTCLLKTGIGSGDAGAGTADRDGQIRSEANVSTGHDAELEDLGPGALALGNTSSDGTLIKGRRRLEVGRSGLSTRHAKCRRGRCRQSRLGGEAGLAEGVAALGGQKAEAEDGDDTHVLGCI